MFGPQFLPNTVFVKKFTELVDMFNKGKIVKRTTLKCKIERVRLQLVGKVSNLNILIEQPQLELDFAQQFVALDINSKTSNALVRFELHSGSIKPGMIKIDGKGDFSIVCQTGYITAMTFK
ncbi:hypothetical protein HYW20_00880 [Candidatus Woesearchaeota archaeon]|nr:hypothetical protein [Candidatus Woesearchaeota archaeon]